ncbi:MAG: tyrosine-type recombinase/integrase [Gammaproteobacteria bacterium]|nr:tyrosine-type recombinase/integrase [Gammaproteobacteria bacterium]
MQSVALVISDAAINRHAADVAVGELRDHKSPLVLRFHKSREKGTWYLVQYQNRQKLRHRLGFWPVLKTKDVQSMVPDMLKKLGTGAEVQSSQFLTVGQLLQWYLARVQREAVKSTSRRKGVVSAIKRHLLPLMGSVAVAALDKAVIDDKLMLPLQAEGLQPSTIRLYYAVLKRAFASASELGLVALNPMAGMKFRDHIQKQIIPKPGKLLVSDAARVQQLILTLTQPVKGLLLFMLLFATRIGETRQMRWEYVDFDASQITIPGKLTKTGVPHILPITDDALIMLQELRQVHTGPWLFGQTDCPSDSDADKLIRIASKGKFSAHDLRKFARSCWATIGIDYWVSERLLNHKQKGLDAVYIKADALDVKHAALTQYHQWLKGRVTCGHYAGIENNKSAA